MDSEDLKWISEEMVGKKQLLLTQFNVSCGRLERGFSGPLQVGRAGPDAHVPGAGSE